MKQGHTAHHFVDDNGNPEGGHSYGTGFSIAWQKGPLGRGEDRKEPNGAFVEDVIDACLERIRFYQNHFPCDENELTVSYLKSALAALNHRTKRREAAGIEGTHQPDNSAPPKREPLLIGDLLTTGAPPESHRSSRSEPDASYRKQLTTIEAHQIPPSDCPRTTEFLAFLLLSRDPIIIHDGGSVKIVTLDGPLIGEPGDWIIRGMEGHYYLCKDAVFQATYTPVGQ